MRFRPLTTADILDALERDGRTVRKVAGYYLGQCPAHDDRRPSLIFGPGRRDDGAFILCEAGCSTADVVRALNVNGSAVPLSPEELERRRAEEEANRDARIARVRARYEFALTHPDRRRTLEQIAPALKWSAEDLLRRGVGWDGDRVVFPIVDEGGTVVGVDRYAPPGSPARELGPKLIAHGARGLWPAPATVLGLRYLVEGAPAAATLLGCGLAAVAYPSASGLRRVDAERLRAASDLIVLADADAVGRRAARTSVLVLRDVGITARAIDLFPDVHDGRDVADELRARDDGVAWLRREIDALQLEEAKR
jgi:putative DNA primase/helicase